MSTIDKKKPLCSPKHLMKEHQDEMTDDNNRETKTRNEIYIEEVHTVNDWEHADLGNDQRKQKFLRLMGVKTRQDDNRANTTDSLNANHDDGLISEKKHCRSKIENETINRELEKQFNEGLQSKILDTHHEGLGFHSNESSATCTSDHDHHQHFVPATIESRPSK